MANIRTQPPGGSRVNYGNPVARGLVEAWVFNGSGSTTQQQAARTLIRRDESSLSGGYAWSTRNGRGRYYSTSYDRWASSAERSMVGACSVVIGFESVLANPSNVQIVGKRDGAAATGMEWGLFSDPTFGVYFSWSNGGSFQPVYNAGTLGAIPAGQYMTAAGTRPVAATSGKLYKNGVLIQSTTGLTAPTSAGLPVTFAAANDGTLLFNGTILWVYLFNRELNAWEVQSIHDNPYSLLTPTSKTFLNSAYSAANVIGANIPGQNFAY